MWFYLFMVVLLSTGQAASAIPQIFTTYEACQTAGEAFAVHVKADTTIKQADWVCEQIDFDVIDPIAPVKHIPGKDEA
jgi:hypothetical protein